MEFIFFFFFGVIVFIIVSVVQAQRSAVLNAAYGQFARIRRGNFTPGGWLSQPSQPTVRFHHADASVTVDIHSTG